MNFSLQDVSFVRRESSLKIRRMHVNEGSFKRNISEACFILPRLFAPCPVLGINQIRVYLVNSTFLETKGLKEKVSFLRSHRILLITTRDAVYADL